MIARTFCDKRRDKSACKVAAIAAPCWERKNQHIPIFGKRRKYGLDIQLPKVFEILHVQKSQPNNRKVANT